MRIIASILEYQSVVVASSSSIATGIYTVENDVMKHKRNQSYLGSPVRFSFKKIIRVNDVKLNSEDTQLNQVVD